MKIHGDVTIETDEINGAYVISFCPRCGNDLQKHGNRIIDSLTLWSVECRCGTKVVGGTFNFGSIG